MKLETLLELMESGKYDNLTVSEFARSVRETEEEAQMIVDEIVEDARLTAQDIKYEMAAQREGEFI